MAKDGIDPEDRTVDLGDQKAARSLLETISDRAQVRHLAQRSWAPKNRSIEAMLAFGALTHKSGILRTHALCLSDSSYEDAHEK
ncbi:hypothetical protein, partial [Caballeronia choica]|uniref:hypothetical protein n=1 Tax=Caballeronia choica TaxID=326476 RepID=UPI001F254262